MSTPKHTPGPWAVLPDPVYKGTHPLHDNRWIVTAGAHWEEEHFPTNFALHDGTAICSMRDTAHQAADAALIALAPQLLAAALLIYQEMGDRISEAAFEEFSNPALDLLSSTIKEAQAKGLIDL